MPRTIPRRIRSCGLSCRCSEMAAACERSFSTIAAALSGAITAKYPSGVIQRLSGAASASAPPEPPSPMTSEVIGTLRSAMVQKSSAMAVPTPSRSSSAPSRRADPRRGVRRAALGGVGYGPPLPATEAAEHVPVHAADPVAGDLHPVLEVFVEVNVRAGPAE